jgi:hypothetical protein
MRILDARTAPHAASNDARRDLSRPAPCERASGHAERVPARRWKKHDAGADVPRKTVKGFLSAAGLHSPA